MPGIATPTPYAPQVLTGLNFRVRPIAMVYRYRRRNMPVPFDSSISQVAHAEPRIPSRVRHPFPGDPSNFKYSDDLHVQRNHIDAAGVRHPLPLTRRTPERLREDLPDLMAPKSHRALPRPRYVTVGVIEYH